MSINSLSSSRIIKDDFTANPVLAREMIEGLKANMKLGLSVIERLDRKDGTGSGAANNKDDAIKALWGFINIAKPIIQNGLNIIEIENRRKDDWDILAEKMENDEMFSETWNELMVLMKLEKSFDD